MKKKCEKSPTGSHIPFETRLEDSLDRDRSKEHNLSFVCKHCYCRLDSSVESIGEIFTYEEGVKILNSTMFGASIDGPCYYAYGRSSRMEIEKSNEPYKLNYTLHFEGEFFQSGSITLTKESISRLSFKCMQVLFPGSYGIPDNGIR